MASRLRAGDSRARNDPRQYDDLAGEWWEPRGRLAMLQWIASARAEAIGPAPEDLALLVDLGCGAGLLAPHASRLGYRHVGIDLVASCTRLAQAHGVLSIQGDVAAVPIAGESAAVVVAGEILEHVSDLESVVAELCRIARPGGLVVLDTIAATRRARLVAVELAERLPSLAPSGIHDPNLFVDRSRLVASFAAHGVELELHGLRPSLVGLAAFWSGRGQHVELSRTRSTAVLFQGVGRKRA